MIDEADDPEAGPERVPQQRRPHAEAWLAKTIAAAADAPRIARSAGDPTEVRVPTDPPAERPDES